MALLDTARAALLWCLLDPPHCHFRLATGRSRKTNLSVAILWNGLPERWRGKLRCRPPGGRHGGIAMCDAVEEFRGAAKEQQERPECNNEQQ